MKICKKLISLAVVLSLALTMFSVSTLNVSASTNSLTLNFDGESDLVTTTTSPFYWQTTSNRVVPSIATEDGMKQGKFEGPSSGTNHYNLIVKNSSLPKDNYIVEMKIKRTTTDTFGVYVQGKDENKIANYKIKGTNSSLAYQAETQEYVDLKGSKGVGAYDIVYLHVDAAKDKCKFYVNSTAYSTEYDYFGSGELYFIRFDVANDVADDADDVVYLDYVKIYPATNFVAPILNVEFDNAESINLRDKSRWSTATNRVTPEIENANGLRAAKMFGNSTDERMYQLGTSGLSISGDVVIETKVKFSSANDFNMCYTVRGTAVNGTAESDGNLNLKTQQLGGSGKLKTFYDSTQGSNVSGAHYETDVIPSVADFNIGWNKIYIRLNTVTGAYKAYINDANTSTSGYMTNKEHGTITNSKLIAIRFDCKSLTSDEANTYIDYIKIYDATGWTAPSSYVKDDIDTDFDGYEVGANAYLGLVNYTNDTISTFSAKVVSDPLNTSDSLNKCLEFSGTAEKILDIGINSNNAVIEYKAYLPEASYCQVANILNTDKKHYTAAYQTNNKNIVNFASAFETIDGARYASLANGWNTFKFIINTDDANEYKLYTFVNGKFVNKEKYQGTLKSLRMQLPRTSGVKLYIDDFSVKYSSGFDITPIAVYMNGEKVTSSTKINKDDIAVIKYTALNSGSESLAKKVIFAVYKNSNNTLSLAQANVLQDADTTYAKGFTDKLHDVTLETNVDFTNGDVVKVFCWNDMNSVIPFVNAVEISK